MGYDGPLKAAIFDLGGVVIEIRVDEIFRHWASAAGLSCQAVAELFKTDSSYERFERGEISPAEFHRLVVGRLGAPISFEQFHLGWNSLFGGLKVGIEELICEVSGIMRVALLSNTNELHARRWTELYRQALGRFEQVFLSHQMGTRKPEPACFQAVLAALGLGASQVVLIDDNPSNVHAAEAMGMKGIVAVDSAQIADDLRRMGVGVMLDC